jgi:hypothetical protein
MILELGENGTEEAHPSTAASVDLSLQHGFLSPVSWRSNSSSRRNQTSVKLVWRESTDAFRTVFRKEDKRSRDFQSVSKGESAPECVAIVSPVPLSLQVAWLSAFVCPQDMPTLQVLLPLVRSIACLFFIFLV